MRQEITRKPGIALSKFVTLVSSFLLILSSCSLLPENSNGPYLSPVASASATGSHAINLTPLPTRGSLTDSDLAMKIVQSMSLDQKLGQMVIVEFYGSALNTDLNQMIQGNRVSGVLIENKNGNAQTRSQLIALNQAMQKAAGIPLFISTDFEGGYVNELRLITGERSSEQTIGATGDPNVAYNAGHSAAADLAALGLNVNFMPIVDVLTNPNNPGLPMRTFGSDPTLVTNMGRAYLKGLTDGVNRSLATLNAVDLVPYRTLIDEGIVPMVMVTHILNPQLDPNLPTSLSPNVVTGILRKQLNFKGVIISDTLWMGGISNTYSLAQAAVLAVKAGTDLLLGPRGLADTQNMIYSLHQAVMSGQISQTQIDASVARILEMKLHYKILSHDKAMQLAGNAVGGQASARITCSCANGVGDEDVRKVS